MQLTIESPGLKPRKDLLDNVRYKFSRLDKFYNRIGHCDVVLKKEYKRQVNAFVVEAKLDVPQKLLFASDKAQNFETAVDKVAQDLEHQLITFKEHLRKKY